ncbi:hypothetical protein COCCADRAFT_35551 [Bipolaris zeicola 26-R-13]|uniref:PEBP-like protein n=1 Tax=Cochliobolus carbonum (strain 26-R-13) TaxID=930089 RepID=W6Y5Q9_COCC2|nr:uncharacterized protein COCCADRAFT_35551 [Bipolaris zeicola 26-R-13]EUC34852.1 hypothetical protein COCCADRAFT_35551 [Bipolaris zeicola 26-R-13]
MFFSTSILAIAIAGLVQAQAPPGFTPEAANKLEVIFNSTMIDTPGQLIPRAAAATQPRLALSSALINMNEQYMFIMLDLDVPPANGTTERRVLLHCMNTGFRATRQQLSGAARLLASSQTGPAAYLPPNPPPVDTVPHRYVELLFKQPSNLSVSESTYANVQNRINFDIEAFMSDNGVDAPLAANYFHVDGRAGAASATGSSASVSGAPAAATGASPSGTGAGAAPSSTLVPFEGAAGKASVPVRTAAQLGGLALFALLVL